MEPLPYYKWLWRDFRASRKVQRMDYIERGLYRELLDECWSQGCIPDDMAELADICGCPVEVMANAWQKISKCFTKADGFWLNDKLDGLRTESDAVRAKRAIAGKSGAMAKMQEAESINNSGKCQSNAEQVSGKCHIAEQSRADTEQSRENTFVDDKSPTCPHQDIIAMYNRILPELQAVIPDRWNGTRSKHLQARWRESPKHQSLDFWERFFNVLRNYSWYLGDNDRGWRANLGWIIEKKNFDNLIEKFITDNRRSATA